MLTFQLSVEVNIIIIAACIPTLVPLYDIILGKRSFSNSSNKKPSYKPYSSFQLRARFGGRNKYMRSGDTESRDGIDTRILQDALSGSENVFVTSTEGGFLDQAHEFGQEVNNEDRNKISVLKQWSVTNAKPI